MKRSDLLKITGISISLSCLFFLRVIKQLFYPTGAGYFEYDARVYEYPAVLLCVLIVASAFAALLSIAYYQPMGRTRTKLQLLFLFFGIAAFGALSCEIITWWVPDAKRFISYPLPIIVLFACLLIPRRNASKVESASANLQSIALVLLPFSLIVVFQTTMAAIGIDLSGRLPNQIENQLRTADKVDFKGRVVWVIFDEFDYAALTNRPLGIEMPAFDRMTTEAFSASNVFPPNGLTNRSIPALLTGRFVSSVNFSGPNQLRLNLLEDGESMFLSESDNIFHEITEVGGNAGVVGWFHPYPRLFPNDLAYAYWRPVGLKKFNSLASCVRVTAGLALESMPVFRDLSYENIFVRDEELVGFSSLFSFELGESIDRKNFQLEKAAELVAKKDLDLVYLHFSIPHPPFMNREDRAAERGYWDTMLVVDETLAMLQEKIAASDETDKTTVIVTSDHWMRKKHVVDFSHLSEEERLKAEEDIRIPFLVKLPGQNSRVSYVKPFNTVITRYLIQAILKGEVKTSDDIVKWLDGMAIERPELMNFRPSRELNSTADR